MAPANMSGEGERRRGMQSQLAILMAGIAVTAIIAVLAVAGYGSAGQSLDGVDSPSELLLKVHLEAHEPYSPPPNMYLWWGPSVNHRFVGSGEHIRHLLHLGQIEGGEWRDPMFLGNNGVATFRSQRFRRISSTCCSTIVIPPMEWDFPVYNTHKIIGQRIRNFVANGNMLVLTGGILAVEFINSYFFYNIELADGNYSPGPYRRLETVPEELKAAPSILPQKGISVTAVKKDSLPSGAEVLWGTPRSSPVFMIKFCEAQSPNEGMPPIKVLPRDCDQCEKEGRPCSCGYLMYIGYTYHEQFPTRWDKVLRGAVEILSPHSKHGGIKADKDSYQSLHIEHQPHDEDADDSSHDEEPRASRGRHSSSQLAVADQKIQLQQQEIDSLEKQVQQLSEVQEKHEVKKARVQKLAQHPASEDSAEDALLRNSVLSLSSDMHKGGGCGGSNERAKREEEEEEEARSTQAQL